jgi:hypothetical protein
MKLGVITEHFRNLAGSFVTELFWALTESKSPFSATANLAITARPEFKVAEIIF